MNSSDSRNPTNWTSFPSEEVSHSETIDSAGLDSKLYHRNIDKETPMLRKTEAAKAFVISETLNIQKQQHESDIAMRKSYARRLIRLLEQETILLFAVLILIGRGWLVFPDLTVQLFLAFSIGQIVSMMLIIVKFLFSKDSHVILRDIASILQEVSRWDRQQEG